jgi:hypothetical protein
MRRGDIRRHWIAVENKWLATRYGMGAMYIRTPAGKRRPLKQDLHELLQRLMPIARETGDDVFLQTLLPLEDFEPGSDRQRRLYREAGDARPVVDDMVARLDAELDASQPSPQSPPPKAEGHQGNGPHANGLQTEPSPSAINPPAATPRASAPPTAGQINYSGPIDLPGSFLVRPPLAVDRQMPLAVRG